MAQTAALIDTLKQALKIHRLTYADVAHRLDMSEANVKRMFASKRFTLERLEDVCRLMQMELTDLFQLYEESRQRISQLTVEQEQELVRDEKLLLVAVSVRNRLTFMTSLITTKSPTPNVFAVWPNWISLKLSTCCPIIALSCVSMKISAGYPMGL